MRLIGLAVPVVLPPLGLWLHQTGIVTIKDPTGVVFMLVLVGILSGLCLHVWWSAVFPVAFWGVPLAIVTVASLDNPRGLDPGPVGSAEIVVCVGLLPLAVGAALGTAIAKAWLHVASRTHD